MALEAMDILTNWSEQQTKKMELAIGIAVATVIYKLGEREVLVTQRDTEEMLKHFYPESRLDPAKGVTVRLVPVEELGEDPKQGKLDLEVTSEANGG